MKAIFGNGTELVYLNAVEQEEYWGGSSRRTLTFTCEPDAISVDALNTMLSDAANTGTLTLVGVIRKEEQENGETVVKETIVQNIYENYTMKLKVGIEPVLVQTESPDSAAVYADRLVFKLGRPTYTEAQMAAIEQQLAALGISAAAQ